MIIQTMQDWNRAAACARCDCDMPVAAPTYDYQSILGLVWLSPGYINPGNGQRYLTRRYNYEGGGFRQTSWDNPYNADLAPTTYPFRVFQATGTDTEEAPTTGDFTTTYSDGPVDIAAALQTGIAGVITWVDANVTDWTGYQPQSSAAGVYLHDGGTPPDTYPMAHAYLSRYRWRIPESFAVPLTKFRGSYAKITWDIARVKGTWPLGSLTGSPDVTLVAEGLTTEWEGPGLIDEPTDESWFTGWHDFNAYMIPPWDNDLTGFVAVNARWEYMRGSRLGNKPIPFGPSWPLP